MMPLMTMRDFCEQYPDRAATLSTMHGSERLMQYVAPHCVHQLYLTETKNPITYYIDAGAHVYLSGMESVEQGGESTLDLELILMEHAQVTFECIVQAPGVMHATIKTMLLGTQSMVTVRVATISNAAGNITITTHQQHAAPHTTSNICVKSLIMHNARTQYASSLVVDPQAQHTDATQKQFALVIGNAVHAQSQPTMEVAAHEVRCAHGSALSALDPLMVWYVQSRGITDDVAQQLLIAGFFSDYFEHEAMQEQLAKVLKGCASLDTPLRGTRDERER